MAKKKRVILIVVGVFLAMTLSLLIGAWAMFGDIIIAANTVTTLEDGLYSVEFKGDYGFDKFLEKGGAASDDDVADYLTEFLSHGFYKADVETEDFGCSTLSVKDEDGNVLFGRNYDWNECHAILIHTKPKNGYESVSTSCLDFLGFGDEYVPDGSLMDKMMALAAIYVPLDGMNEKGLMIADLMAGDKEVTHQDTGKVDLTTTVAIRLLLDRAATVDEAISLLSQYDMHSSIETAHHLSIADRSGKSVVVEYIGGKMLVTEANIVTNHYLTEGEKYGIGSEQSHMRFDTLTRAWESTDGVMEHFELLDMMKSVAQFNYPQTEGSYEKTLWTVIYHPEALTLDFYYGENYERFHIIELVSKSSVWIR